MAKRQRPAEDEDIRAFRVARDLWYLFLDTKIKRPEQCGPDEQPVSAADVALELFDRSVEKGCVNPRLQELLLYAKEFRDESVEQESSSLPPPIVVFHPVNKSHISANVSGPSDQFAAEGAERPASWLFQKRIVGEGGSFVMQPYIAVDRDSISIFLGGGKGRAISELNSVILRIILHELFHYVMHWRTLLPAGLPENKFRYEWANHKEEREAWIGCHATLAMAVAAVAVVNRLDGGFDAAWKYP